VAQILKHHFENGQIGRLVVHDQDLHVRLGRWTRRSVERIRECRHVFSSLGSHGKERMDRRNTLHEPSSITDGRILPQRLLGTPLRFLFSFLGMIAWGLGYSVLHPDTTAISAAACPPPAGTNVVWVEDESGHLALQRRPSAFNALLFDLLDLSLVQRESKRNELSGPGHLHFPILRLNHRSEDFPAPSFRNLLNWFHRVSFR
jgi:hypothetical protein